MKVDGAYRRERGAERESLDDQQEEDAVLISLSLSLSLSLSGRFIPF